MSPEYERGEQLRPSPEPIFRIFTAYWATQTLCAAIEHDLFALIDQGRHTAGEIADAARISERGLRDRFSFIDGDFHRIDLGVERYEVILLSHLVPSGVPGLQRGADAEDL